jgi:hypothetical protein
LSAFKADGTVVASKLYGFKKKENLETLVKKHNTKMIRFIVYQLFRYLPVLGPHFVLKTVWILPQEVNAMFV